MNRILELYYPAMCSFAMASIYFIWFRDHKLPASVTQLFSAIVGISGVAVGFLATTKSILFAIDDRLIIKKLKSIDRYRPILKYMRSAIGWSFLLSILSAIGLLIDFASSAEWHPVFVAVWIWAAMGCICSCHRVLRVFYKILDQPDE